MMKNLLLVLLMFLSFSAFADQSTCEQLKADSNTTKEQLAQSGCCSWHGGVCGCSGAVVQCCDGAASPSCRCHANELIEPKAVEADIPKS